VSDKPYAPTPNRIVRARREGRRPHAPELGSVAAFGCALLVGLFAIPSLLASAAQTIVSTAKRPALDGAVVPIGAFLCCSLVVLAGGALAAAASSALDGGLHVNAPTFELKRLEPGAGLRRMFGRDGVIAALRAAALLAASLCALAAIGRDVIGRVLERSTPQALAGFAAAIALRGCATALAIGGLFALADRWLAHRRWLEGLRMTHEELKRDLRESEGDPHTKGRRKSLHRALARGSIARVREASFVVANPEHIAIALRYAPPAVPVPEILVRACDEVAGRVKAIARAHHIPIIEDVALARALFVQCEAGDPIPRELYLAVAQIVAALARAGSRG
jgi:flagellar biosynthetic protein FlhB